MERTLRSRRLPALFAGIVMCAGIAVAAVGSSPATAAPPDLSGVQLDVVPFASGLSSPVAITWRHNDARMYVAEKTGKVRIISTAGVVSPTAVLTVSVAGGDEQGLLGIAFSPDGTKLYVDYVDPTSVIRIVEYTMSGDIATSPRELLSINHPRSNHNGGEVVTGPDGKLYIGTGDGGGAGDPDLNGQNVNSLLGKILRIDPTPSASLPYTIPSDNPFFGQSGHRGEIWMYGLRNPWRFTFDRLTGELYIADVGQGLYEEVDVAAAGAKGTNWSWNLREGFHPYQGGAQPPGGQDPRFELTHSDGYCAVIGGFVYRGSAIANLNGAYVYTDLCKSNIAAYADPDQRVFTQSLDQPTTFGEDPSGELYVAALDGTVSKLVQSVAPTVSVGDQKMLEGDTGTRKMTFTVSLSTPATKSVSVHYAIAGVTAMAGKSKKNGVDVKSATGSVSFKKGSISKTVSASVYGDTSVEPDETFSVTLSSPPAGYALGRATGTGTVLNDDGGTGSAAIGIGDAAVVRSGGGQQDLVLPVALTARAPKSFTVSYTVTPGSATYSATPAGGGDFGGSLSGALEFGRGTWLRNIVTPIYPNGESGENKTFTVTLNGVDPAGVTVFRATGTGTILDH